MCEFPQGIRSLPVEHIKQGAPTKVPVGARQIVWMNDVVGGDL